MVGKLRHYLLYLVMIKLNCVYKPNTIFKDIQKKLENSKKFSPSPWLHHMIRSSKIIHNSAYEYRGERHPSFVTNSRSHYQPITEYSIWDRVCTEELLFLRESLEAEDDDSMEVLNKTFFEPNEVFDNYKYTHSLSKSKLELLLEAHKLNTLLSNNDELSTEKKVKISLTLANLTGDVNHVLGALIYLL